ncbi:MAG TPA: hypothetical protein VK177_17105 [Flavobacteriales bacterium]|nr:hypothetical protein [Flavobacteriales bacterium]
MNKINVFLVLILFSANLFAQESKDIKILYPVNRGAKVFKWEKLELGIVLPEPIATRIKNFVSANAEKDKLNPFDPEHVSVEAAFQYTGKTNELIPARTVYGFYYEEYRRKQEDLYPDKWTWIAKRNDYPLRIRFAPEKAGEWTCHVKLVIHKTEITDLGEIKFECIESASKGQIELSPNQDLRHRYLKYSEKNEMFFPVGMNLVWARLDELRVKDHDVYKGWFEQLGKANANFVQLSSLPFTYGVEQEVLNNYTMRLPNAWEFDELLEMAKLKGIYINLLTLIHDEFLTGQGWIHKNNHWTNNPYNSAKNGGLTNAKQPGEFFTDEVCKSNFKKRLRYIMSRYGYSVNLSIIELLSEVDNAIPGYNDKNKNGETIRAAFKKWFIEMRSYIQDDLGYKKLVSVSYTQSDQSKDIAKGVFPIADVVLLHFYGRDRFTNFKNRYTEHFKVFQDHPLTKYKPCIFDEMGVFYPGLDYVSDLMFHSNLWATTFMGSFGTGQNWWWDNGILKSGFEKNFTGLQKFLQGEDFLITETFGKAYADGKSKFKTKAAYELYYLQSKDGTKAVGWVHSFNFYWANLKNTNTSIARMISDNNGKFIDPSDDTQYGTEFVKRKATGVLSAKPGESIQFKLSPSTDYIIKWYNTSTGEMNGITQQVKSSSSGKVKFDIPAIDPATNPYGDYGFKIVKYSR